MDLEKRNSYGKLEPAHNVLPDEQKRNPMILYFKSDRQEEGKELEAMTKQKRSPKN